MKAKISFLFLFIIQIISAKSQEYKLIFLVDTPTKFITTDAFKNLFIITTDNAIIKYDSAGKKLAAQRFVTEGELKFFDASNTLQNVAFFPNTNTVYVLDNALNKIGSFDFTTTNISVGCRAVEGGIWVYSPSTLKLYLVSNKNEILRESLPLNNLPIKKLKPILLFNDEKYLYLLDAEKGILLFDNFGSYLKTIHLEDIKNIQVLNSLVYYFTNGKLHHLNPQTFADDAVNLPPLSGAEKQVFINADKLWLSSDGGVKLFLKK